MSLTYEISVQPNGLFGFLDPRHPVYRETKRAWLSYESPSKIEASLGAAQPAKARNLWAALDAQAPLTRQKSAAEIDAIVQENRDLAD